MIPKLRFLGKIFAFDRMGEVEPAPLVFTLAIFFVADIIALRALQFGFR